jgi:PAS domain S-box-containing protein
MPLSVSRILMWAFGLMVAGLALCVGTVIWTAYDNITLAHRISVLTALDRRIFDTRQALRIEFGAMQTALVMEDDPEAALAAIYRKLDTAAVNTAKEVARIDVPAARARLPNLEEKLARSRERWTEILAIGRRPKSERDLADTKGWDLANTEVHDEFTTILDAIGGLLRLIDPVAAQYYLIHRLAWNYRVEAGRECSVNRPLIVSGTAMPPDRRKWTDAQRTMVETFRSLLLETLAHSSVPDTLMEALKAADGPYRASLAARETAYAKLGKETGAAIAPDEWRRVCNAPFQPILTIATTALDLMTSHANARLRQGQLQLIGTAVILLIAITATIVSLRLVRRRIHAPLANLIATTYRFSTGDFASPVPTLRGEDEFSTMAQTLEGLRLTALEEQRMRNRLEHLVEERTRSLQEHEAKVRRLVDANIIGIFMWESGGRIMEANDAFLRTVGYDRADLVSGRVDWRKITPDKWRAADEQALAELGAVGIHEPYEKEYFRKDGSCVPVMVGAAFFEGSKKEGVAFVLDVTERKRAEAALRESEANLNRAQEIAHIGSWHLDIARNQLTWSNEVYRLFGRPRGTAALDYDAFLDMVHPEDRERVERAWAAALQGAPYDIEHRILVGDELKWVRERAEVEFDRQGKAVRGIGTVRDITDRKRAEESLRQSEAYLADAQRLSHTGSWAFDVASGKFIYASEECFRMYERDAQEGLPTREATVRLIHPEDRDRVQEGFEKSLRDKVDTASEFRLVLPSGTVKHVHAIRHPVLNEVGDVVRLVGTTIDITERKRAEQERDRLRQLEADLAHINRVSLLGELTASIAHEVNQPLAGVVSNAGACLRWLAGDPPNLEKAREALSRIGRDGKRAGEIIARIRAMTKKAATPNEKLALNDTIQDVLALVRDEATRNRVILRPQFADGLAPVAGDRVQLQQVVLNLVLNGIEAMGSVGGRARQLVIATRNLDPDQVQVTVDDAGTGIDPSALGKIFDPFYTTKPGGMGMGLSISRSIVEAHGGRLWATAKDGPGTLFHFTLPTYQEDASHA